MTSAPALRTLFLCLGLGAAISLGGCQKREDAGAAPAPAPAAASAQADSSSASLDTLRASSRKIIKDADLVLTVDSPSAAARDAAGVAKRFSGYVVESRSIGGGDEAEPANVRVVIKVDADRFDDALDVLRRMSKSVGSESIKSQDVTDEYVDVEARIKTDKKLEQQYLTLLDKATTVEDTLKVQKQLAEVRGSIEKLEGRKRVLDNQTRLSTITVNFERDQPLVAVSGSQFGRAVKHAGADVVNVGAGIITGLIRFSGVMIPIVLLLLLPLALIGRALLRRVLRSSSPTPA